MVLIDPLPGRYDASDPYGSLAGGRSYPHTGSDWIAPAGTPVPALGAGRVVNKGWHAGNGNYITVSMPDGMYYACLHGLKEAAPAVGDWVELAQSHIFEVGNTGTNSQGNHLHVTISDSPRAFEGLGNRVDPWAYIQARLVAAAPPTLTAKGHKMYLEWDTGGTGWLVLEGGWYGLPSMQIRNLFRRVIISDQMKEHPDTFFRQEVDMMDAIQVATAQRPLKGAYPQMPTLDTAKLTDAVATSLHAAGIPAAADTAASKFQEALDLGFARSMKGWANALIQAPLARVPYDIDKLSNSVAESLQVAGIARTEDTDLVQYATRNAIDRAGAARSRQVAKERELYGVMRDEEAAA